jgi:hypothetical protein
LDALKKQVHKQLIMEEEFLTLEEVLSLNPTDISGGNGDPRDFINYLDDASIELIEKARGAKAGPATVRQAGEMFRLAGSKWNVDPNMDYNASLAANQSFGEQLKNTVIGGAYQYMSGFLDNFNYDIPDLAGMMTGKEKEYGNWLSEITKNMREKSEDYPIYLEGDSFADPAYWARQGQNLSYSVGLATGALAEQAAMTALTAETGGLSAPMQAASLARKGALAKQFLFGGWKGIHEGYINGLETYNQVHDDYLRRGKSKQEAVSAASRAASIGYRREVGPLMALNALQFGLVGKYNPFVKQGGLNMGFSGAVETLTNAGSKQIKNRNLRGVVDFLLQGAAEGFEEGIQTGVSKYAAHRVLAEDFEDFTSLHLWDQEMTDSVVGGVLGGFLFAGMGAASNKLMSRKSTAEEARGQQHDKFIAGVAERTKKDLQRLQEAEKNGEENKANQIKAQMQMSNVMESLQLDFLNKKETAFDSYVKSLEEIQAQQEQPLPEIQTAIANAYRVKATVVEALRTQADPRAAFEIAHKKESMKLINDLQRESRAELERMMMEDDQLKGLSSEEKYIFERWVTSYHLGELKHEGLATEEQLKRLEFLNKEQEEDARDSMFLFKIDQNLLGKFYERIALIEDYRQVKDKIQDKLNYWYNPDNQAVERKKAARAAKNAAMKAARTAGQVDQAMKELEQEGALDEKSADAMEAKKVELGVQDTEETRDTSDPHTVEAEEDQIFDFEEFTQMSKPSEERKSLADQIFDNTVEDESDAIFTEDDEDFFYPGDTDPITPELEQALKGGVESYVTSLKLDAGKEPTFLQFVADMVQNSDKERVKRKFHQLVKGWEANEYAPADYDSVYNTLFGDRKELADDLLNMGDIITDTATLQEETGKVVDQVEDEARANSLDSNRRKIADAPNTYRIAESDLKFAFSSRRYRMVVDKNDDTTVFGVEDVDDALNRGTLVNSDKLLRKDYANAGSKFIVEQYSNLEDPRLKVKTWNDDGTPGPIVTFSSWARNKGLTPADSEWQDKVPMVIKDTETGEAVAFLHDVEWYNPVTTAFKEEPDVQEDLIDEAQTLVREVRARVRDNGSATIEVTKKRIGTIVKTPEDSILTLAEANPQTTLTIFNGEVLQGADGIVFDPEDLLNKDENFKFGHAYDVRPGTNEGEFMAFPVLRDTVDPAFVETIYQSALIYLDGFAKQKQEARDAFRSATGLDLYSISGFQEYARQFLTFSSKGGKKFAGDNWKTIANDATKFINNLPEGNLKTGAPYFFTQANKIFFGLKNTPSPVKGVQTMSLNLKSPVTLSYFKQAVALAPQNVNRERLSSKKGLAKISPEGRVIPLKTTYMEHLMSSLKTNVKSFNVGTEAQPEYATFIQPVIQFRLDYNVDEEVRSGDITENTIQTVAKKVKDSTPTSAAEDAVVQEKRKEVEAVVREESVAEAETLTPEESLEISEDQLQIYRDALATYLESNDETGAQMIRDIVEAAGVELDSEGFFNAAEELSRTLYGDLFGMSVLQNSQLIDHIFNQMAVMFSYKFGESTSKQEMYDSITQHIVRDYIEPRIEKYNQTIKNLESLPTNSRLETLIEATKIKVRDLANVKANWVNGTDGIFEQAYMKLLKYTEGSEIVNPNMDAVVQEDENQLAVDYSKISLEDNSKDRSSYRLRRFLQGIKDVDENQKVRTGFLDLERYVGYNTVYDKIKEVLNSPNQVPSTIGDIIARLQENVPAYPYLQQVIDKLESSETDTRIRDEFVYNFPDHNASYKFVMLSQDRSGGSTLKVYDANSGDIFRVIKKRWTENLKSPNNTLTRVNEEGQYVLNPARAAVLKKIYEQEFLLKARAINAGKAGLEAIDLDRLQEWVAQFGIELSPKTLRQIRGRGLRVGNARKATPFKRMFDIGANNSSRGLFGVLYGQLNNIINAYESGNSLEFMENESMNPLNNIGAIGDAVARIESQFMLYTTTKTFRDGDKTFSGFIAPTHSTDMIRDLKVDQDTRDVMLKTLFTKHSLYLKALNEDPNFRRNFGIVQIANTALKELGKRSFRRSDITSLSSSDHEMVKLGLFQDLRQGDASIPSGFGIDKDYIKTRQAIMFLPTMSDKSRMSGLKTIVFNVRNSHVDLDNRKVEDKLLDLVYSQVLLPELDRIIEHHKAGGKTGIKGYDMAAKLVNLFPAANKITNSEGVPLLLLLEKEPATYTHERLMQEFGDQFRGLLNEYIFSEAEAKVTAWEAAGFIGRNENGVKKIKFLNKPYFDSFKGTVDEKAKMGAIDFVINSAIANANSFMLLAGDPANYGQDKHIKKYFKDGKVYAPNTEKFGNLAYEAYSRFGLGTNIGKRLANLIAPGRRLSMDSRKEKYMQIFLNDFIDHSTNIQLLAEKLDGKKLTASDLALVRKGNAEANGDTSLTQEEKAEYKKLKSKFPNSAPYFELESTDAQEYTTVSEHLRVLKGQGRIEQDLYQELAEKAANQAKAIAEGKPIAKKDLYTVKEIEVFFQPMKPVHTGFKHDTKHNIMRMMYVKSSSIPLLPQVTEGLELDGLRQLMEAVESKGKLKVRASYQTANKVGTSDSPLYVFDGEGKFNTRLLEGIQKGNKSIEAKVQAASVVLDRNNFRIQQDVPFKLGKDEVTLGTQTLKLLFGNGVTKLKGFNFLGTEMTGQELKNKFNEVFDERVSLAREKLMQEIGFDSLGEVKNPKKTKVKLQKLLQDEAKKRGYPRQDIEALELLEVKNPNGKVIDFKFKLPPWVSPNANRYESLLNAIINNRLVKLKMPGASFVVASEAGFKAKTGQNLDTSKIVYTSAWEGELKAAELESYKTEKGGTRKRVKKAQVFAPSRFKDTNGNLIELVYPDGTYNEMYVEKTDKGLRLKEDMIGERFREMMSFRIPTSSHVSMSQLEVVGFLPPEVGDVLVVPSNLTKQKGLDFDIDKETAYMHVSYVDNMGRVSVFGLSEVWRADAEKVREYYEKVKEAYESNKDANQSIAELQEEFDEMMEDETIPLEEIARLQDSLVAAQKRSEATWATKEKMREARKMYNMYFGYQAQIKTLNNMMVEAHRAVLTHPSDTMFKKVNSVLSMEFANEQAEMIDEEVNNATLENFSLLSDEYQKQKMELGSSGKLGIGVYSNAVVFNSMVQQGDKRIALTKKVTQDGETKRVPFEVTIGGLHSKGELGKIKALGVGNETTRDIADILAERQNTATDNEKERIMGRVNVNGVTINVDTILTLLGFDKAPLHLLEYYDKESGSLVREYFDNDRQKSARIAVIKEKQGGVIRITKDYTDISVPYAILSQPIIKRFVKEVQQGQSLTSNYDPNLEKTIVDQLFEEYDYEGSQEVDAEEVYETLTGKVLFENLANPDPMIQTHVLKLFMSVKGRSEAITTLQSQLNINNGGLGRSFFDVIEKYRLLANGNSSYANIKNAESLIGDIVNSEDSKKLQEILEEDEPVNIESPRKGRLQEIKQKMFDKGYYWFSDPLLPETTTTGRFIKPTTPVGSMLVKSVHSGYNLWKNYFPYSNPTMLGEFATIKNEILGKEDASSQRTSELYQKFFQEFKKFMASSAKNNLFTGDIQEERARLFLDNENNKSLATFLKEQMAKDPELRKNKLLSRFEYKLEKNGNPSLLIFDNSRAEDFDEDYLYLALLELMQDERSLGPYAGKADYTTRDLAEDLVRYSYLGEPVQEAIQFIKYIPISYLNQLGFSENMRKIDPRNPKVFAKLFAKSGKYSKFVLQYIQHNPQLLPKVELSEDYVINKEIAGKGKNKVVTSFELDITHVKLPNEVISGRTLAPFVSYYNPDIRKGAKKFQLYQLQEDGTYQQIQVLGSFGMSEYQISVPTDEVTSIVNPVGGKAIELKASVPVTAENQSTLQQNPHTTLAGVLKEISERGSENPYFATLATELLDRIPNDIGYDIVDFAEFYPNNTSASGVYSPNDNTIYLNSAKLGTYTQAQLDKVVLHETFHALTVKDMRQYFKRDANATNVEGSRPTTEMIQLKNLFLKAKSLFTPQEIEEMKSKFSSDKKFETSEERLAYGVMDIFEFVTFAMTEPAFQKKLNSIPYEKSGMTFFERFKELVTRVLSKITGLDPDSYLKETVATVFAIIDTDQSVQNDTSPDYVFDGIAGIQAAQAIEQVNDFLNTRDKKEDTQEGFEENILLSPDDFIFELEAPRNDFRYTVVGGMPFSDELISKVTAREQQITIRTGKKVQDGLYNVKGNIFMVKAIGGGPININYLLEKGKTKEDIEKAFKGIPADQLRVTGVKDWFEGKGTRRVYFVKDVTAQHHFAPSELAAFEAYKENFKKNC